MELTITGTGELEADFREFPARSTRAAVRALSRAIGSARTILVRAIANDTGLRSSDVSAALKLKEPTFASPTAVVSATLARIPLFKFNAQGPRPSRGKGRGVSYKMQGGRTRVENAFIAAMASGHEGVFKRAGTARLPIRELYGPSLGHVFLKYKYIAEQRAIATFTKNFDHEMQFAASQGADSGLGSD